MRPYDLHTAQIRALGLFYHDQVSKNCAKLSIVQNKTIILESGFGTVIPTLAPRVDYEDLVKVLRITV